MFPKKFNKDFILILLLLLLTLVVWWRLVKDLTFVSEAFMYYLKAYRVRLWGPLFFSGFETFAVIFGNLFVGLFGYHIYAFFWIELVIICSINILFYAMVRTITNNRLVAFCAGLILSVNFFGLFDIYEQHDPAWFLERVSISLPCLLLSFLFLHLFLSKKSKKYYFISIIIYFVGQFLVRFGTLFTAPFVLYPIFWQLFNKNKPKEFQKNLLVSASYGVISYALFKLEDIEEGILSSYGGITHFIFHPFVYQYPKKIALQLAYWSQYPLVFRGLGEINIFSYRADGNYIWFTPLVLVVYILASVFIYKKLPKMRAILLTVILGTIASFFLNAYLDAYKILSQSLTNRYLYHPTFLLSIFWALFFWALFKTWGKFAIFLTVFILIVYYGLNYELISRSFDYIYYGNIPTKAVYDYMFKTRGKLEDNTLVVVPFPALDSYATTFFTEQLGRNKIRYVTDKNPYYDWQQISKSYPHVQKITYDDKCNCIFEQRIK